MIKQCYTAAPMRRKFSGFRERWGLARYDDPDAPAVFYGMYGDPERKVLRAHRGFALVIWCGSDASVRPRLPLFKRRPEIRHAATSRWIEADLRRFGLRYRRLNLVGVDLAPFRESKLGTEVYAYIPATRPQLYGGPVLRKASSMLPKSLKINVVRDTAMGLAGVIDAYQRAFVGVRLTGHDGMAATVIEMGMMGRRSIHNGDGPCSVNWRTAADVADAIKGEMDRTGKRRPSVRRAVQGFVEDGNQWLDLAWWG